MKKKMTFEEFQEWLKNHPMCKTFEEVQEFQEWLKNHPNV